MKRLVIYLLPIMMVISCTGLTPEPDPADAFVGRYTYTDNYFVTWGGDSGSLSNNGAFQLTKLSKNQVKMTGAWTSIGEVVGNTVTFSNDMQSDSAGYITYSFGVGTLTGNTLIFNYSGSGSLKYSANGVAYPWTCSGRVVATNIDK
jgi:hypothetical protein